MVGLMSSYDVVVDVVEQRARNLAHVVGALILVADAFLLGVPIVPARARIHRSHEHKRGGIFGAVFRPTDAYDPILQQLTHNLKHISRNSGNSSERKKWYHCNSLMFKPKTQKKA